MEFANEKDHKMSLLFAINASWFFFCCFMFVMGYAFKTFENGVRFETRELKLLKGKETKELYSKAPND